MPKLKLNKNDLIEKKRFIELDEETFEAELANGSTHFIRYIARIFGHRRMGPNHLKTDQLKEIIRQLILKEKSDIDVEKYKNVTVGKKKPDTMAQQRSRDPDTNCEQVTVSHIDIDWDVEFDARRLAGQVTLKCTVLQNTDKIVLDGRDLEIESISHDGQELKFNSESDEVFGSRITVVTGALQPGQALSILIKYRTAPEARALQFLSKEQTTDKLAPYPFSQCQAIHARSIVPTMDTPSVKATYSAKVSVPTGLMSAIGEKPVVSGEKTVWTYRQKVAIPSPHG